MPLGLVVILAIIVALFLMVRRFFLKREEKRHIIWQKTSSIGMRASSLDNTIEELIQKFKAAGLNPEFGDNWSADDIINAARKLGQENHLKKEEKRRPALFRFLEKRILLPLKKIWKGIVSVGKFSSNLFSRITKWLWKEKWYAFATLAIIFISFVIGASLGLKQIQIPDTQNAVLKSKALILEKQVSTLKKELQAKDTLLTKMAEMVKQSPPSTIPLKRFPAPSVKLIELSQSVQQTTEPTKICTVERQGEALWQVLAENIGKLPTTEEMKRVVTANNLPETTDANGQWIVKIYPGQRLNISSLFPT